MWKYSGLLMKQQIRFPCFGSTLKVCVAFIILTSASSLACASRGWDSSGRGHDRDAPYYKPREEFLKFTVDRNYVLAPLDQSIYTNLSGITDTQDRNIKTAWGGWKPNKATLKEWDDWYERWLEEIENIGEIPRKTPKRTKAKGKKYDTEDSDKDYAERGPGSSWPDLYGWSALGFGSDGAPVPPWGFAPRNVGKRSLCFLPVVKGTCKDTTKEVEKRWGYNPYMDECQEYAYSGCGGTRNRFATKNGCKRHCTGHTPTPTCSSDSGIKDTSKRG